MGNSTANSHQQTTEVNPKKPQKKHGPQHQHLLSVQHEERLRRFLLQEQLGRWMDDANMEVRIDASEYKPEELKVSVQSGRLLVKGKHEEKKEDGSAYVKKSFSRSYTLPKEAQADQMVSNLSSDGVLVITTPKSAPAIKNETPKDK